MLFYGRKKVEESIDLENWMVNEYWQDCLPKMKLHIVATLLPELGDSITKIRVDTNIINWGRSRLTQEDIRFCAKLFCSFQNIQTITSSDAFWKCFLDPDIDDITDIDETKIDKTKIVGLFSDSRIAFSQVKLECYGTKRTNMWKYYVLKPIGEVIFCSNETFHELSAVNRHGLVLSTITREEHFQNEI